MGGGCGVFILELCDSHFKSVMDINHALLSLISHMNINHISLKCDLVNVCC